MPATCLNQRNIIDHTNIASNKLTDKSRMHAHRVPQIVVEVIEDGDEDPDAGLLVLALPHDLLELVLEQHLVAPPWQRGHHGTEARDGGVRHVPVLARVLALAAGRRALVEAGVVRRDERHHHVHQSVSAQERAGCGGGGLEALSKAMHGPHTPTSLENERGGMDE
jgi:hypothetical protein